MRYYCDICLEDVKEKNKSFHLKSKCHTEFEKYNYIKLSLKNVDIKHVDETLCLYMKHHKKNFTHFVLKGEFKPVFNINQDCNV